MLPVQASHEQVEEPSREEGRRSGHVSNGKRHLDSGNEGAQPDSSRKRHVAKHSADEPDDDPAGIEAARPRKKQLRSVIVAKE